MIRIGYRYVPIRPRYVSGRIGILFVKKKEIRPRYRYFPIHRYGHDRSPEQGKNYCWPKAHRRRNLTLLHGSFPSCASLLSPVLCAVLQIRAACAVQTPGEAATFGGPSSARPARRRPAVGGLRRSLLRAPSFASPPPRYPLCSQRSVGSILSGGRRCSSPAVGTSSQVSPPLSDLVSGVRMSNE